MDTLKEKPKIGVDFDDVIFGFMEGFLLFTENNFGDKKDMEEVKSFFLEDVWGVTAEEMTARIGTYYHSEYHHNAPPIDGALRALEKLSQDYDIHIITSSPGDILSFIKGWLERNGFTFISQIHCTRVVMTDQNPRKKIDIARELGIIYMIDDASHTAEQFVSSGIGFFLLGKPWNKNFNMDHVIRVENWGEIENKILGK